ncbi:MAG: CapA family protein [Acidimicrobiales bacterium]
MTRRGRPGVLACVVALLLAACGGGDRSAPTSTTSAAAAPVETPTTSTSEVVPRSVGLLAPHQRPRHITVVAGGDVLIHQAVWQSAWALGGGERFDFAPLFEPIAPSLMAADLALCHLEVPLSPDSTDLSSFPMFNAPGELADGLAAAGYDGCSFASNHTLDRGVAGIDATLDHLDRVGLGHVGAARTEAEASTVTMYDVRGTRIAHLSYTYGFNGLRRPAGEEWRANLIATDAIVAEAARAREHGADVVLLSLHFGDEYVHEPSRHQRDVAAAVVAAADVDVDVIIGHHAHVVQPVEQVDGTWVFFGVGNQLSNMGQAERRDGALAHLTIAIDGAGVVEVVRVAAIPTFVELPGHRVVPAPPDSHDRTMGHLRSAGVDVLAHPAG